MRPHLPLVVGACAAGLLPACTQAPEAPERPNVLFILLDDLAYDAIGSSGRYPFLETPNISRLQREGVTFSNFFCTMSLSSPSRACFLTGVYPHLHGVTQNDVRVDPLWDVYTPYPQLLQERGYETAFIGKMHNAELWGKEQIRPGFDYWLGFRGQGDYFNPVLNDNGREFRAEGYITDLLTDYACRWLTEERDRSKPFAMCLWHKAVHMPFKAAPRHEGCYADQTLPLPPNGNGVEDYTGKPAWQKYKKSFDRIWEHDPEWNPHFEQPLDILETLRAVDESIGTLYATLERTGELDNTIILFASDNGYFMGEHGYWDKRIAYEESMRIPMIVRYPHAIAAGSRIDEMCLNIDIAPTLLEMSGTPVPDWMQGRSLVPLLRGDTTGWRRSFLFEYFVDDAYPYAGPTMLAVRTDRYKLVDSFLEDDIDELYDLQEDPGEMRNLIAEPLYDSLRQALRTELERLKVELKFNPDRDFHLREAAPAWEAAHADILRERAAKAAKKEQKK